MGDREDDAPLEVGDLNRCAGVGFHNHLRFVALGFYPFVAVGNNRERQTIGGISVLFCFTIAQIWASKGMVATISSSVPPVNSFTLHSA